MIQRCVKWRPTSWGSAATYQQFFKNTLSSLLDGIRS